MRNHGRIWVGSILVVALTLVITTVLFTQAFTSSSPQAPSPGGSSVYGAPTVTVFTAGNMDNFDTSDGAEPASPSDDLLLLMDPYGGGDRAVFPHRQFDNVNTNRVFGHTFTDLPPCIVAATLEIRMRAAGGGVSNDSLSLERNGINNNTPSTFWAVGLSALITWETGQTTTWSTGTTQTFILDLANLPSVGQGPTNITPFMNADQALDVYVQDDTAVDYMELTVTADCPPPETVYLYSVKFVCGVVRPLGPKPWLPELTDPLPVVPGVYRTAINVHNFADTPLTLTKRVTVALPQTEPRGPISETVEDILGPGEALEVDCRDVVRLLGGDAATAVFIKGFLTIESPTELEVVAVYTQEELLEQGISIDVVRQQVHVIERVVSQLPGEKPELAIEKALDGDFPIGGTGTYVITVTNDGDGTASPPIVVVDTLPFGFTFIAGSESFSPPASPPGSCTITNQVVDPSVDQQVVECTYNGTLGSGDIVTLMIQVNVDPIATGPPGPNCATVNHPDDTDSSNNESCVATVLSAGFGNAGGGGAAGGGGGAAGP